MSISKVTKSDLEEAKQHFIIALGEIKGELPKSHEELIEYFRDYFADQKVEVFSRFVADKGEGEFRDFIAEVVLDSGLYHRDEDDVIRPKPRP